MDVTRPSIVDLIGFRIDFNYCCNFDFNGMQTSCDGSSDGEITILASRNS